MVTQSSLATGDCLSELTSSALLDPTERQMAKTLLGLYNRGCKIYSVLAYQDPCVLLLYEAMELAKELRKSFYVLFWMTVLYFAAYTNRGMMTLWTHFVGTFIFASSAGYVCKLSVMN